MKKTISEKLKDLSDKKNKLSKEIIEKYEEILDIESTENELRNEKKAVDRNKKIDQLLSFIKK